MHWIRFSRLAFYKRPHRPKLDEELEPVSVVVCASDSYEYLTELIPSLLSQDYPQFEVVVVNDCSGDETEEYLKDLERRESRIKPVQMRQHLNFFNGKKFPLSMGIKSASYDLLVLTDAGSMPTSDQWLRSVVSCYGHNTQVVIGYSPLRTSSGLLNKLMRFESFQNGILYLSAALAGKPYMGVGKNLSYRKKLFFKNKGFTSHYSMPAGDDDVFVSQVATKKNTSVLIDAENTIITTPKSGFGDWVRQRCDSYSTIRLHRPDTRASMAVFYWSQFLFYVFFIILLFLSPAFALPFDINPYLYYHPILLFLFLLRYATQLIIYGCSAKRVGEKGLLGGLILFDPIFAIVTPLFRITGRLC